MAKRAVQELPELLDVKQVAAYLKLHEVTVLNFARQGKLPGFKVGREWRFRIDEIKAWIEASGRTRAAFADRFNALWDSLGQAARASGCTVQDVPRLIEEVRKAHRTP